MKTLPSYARKDINEVRQRLEVFQDPEFHFDEERHRYTYRGAEFVSVTKFLSTVKRPFDEEFWAKKKARQLGVSPEQMKAQWADKRERAGHLGHEVHAGIEGILDGSGDHLHDDPEVEDRLRAFRLFYQKKMSRLVLVAKELRMFSVPWRKSGTLDALMYHLDKRKFFVGDWKTNGGFKTDEDRCFGNLLPPFAFLKENELNLYSMQISIYRLMLWQVGIPTAGGFICHIPPQPAEPEIHNARDLRSELYHFFESQR